MLGKLLTEQSDRRVKIDRRRVLEPADLFAHFRHDLGVTMADRNRDDPGKGVEVALAGFVPDVLHMAFDDQAAARDNR